MAKDIEMETMKEKLKINNDTPKKLRFFHLFRYADCLDVILTVTSAICAIIAGVLVPGRV